MTKLEQRYHNLVADLIEQFQQAYAVPFADENTVEECEFWILSARHRVLVEWFKDNYTDWADLGWQHLENEADMFRTFLSGEVNGAGLRAIAEEVLLKLVTEDYHDLRHEIEVVAERRRIFEYAGESEAAEHRRADYRDRFGDMRGAA